MPTPNTFLFVGCCNRPTPYYATSNGEGIASFAFDEETGLATPIAVKGGIDNPTFLSVDPTRNVLHANSEVFGWNEGTVSAYSIDPATGHLRYINKQPTRGSLSAHNSRDRKDRFLLVANYSDGPEDELPNKAFVVLPIRDDGSLEPGIADAVHIGSGPNPERQERPHPHSILATPDNRYLVVADLGLDLLISYRFDAATGEIARSGASALPPGSGPRHFVFHPNGRRAYVVNELASSVSSLTYDPDDGSFVVLHTEATVPEAVRAGNSCSEIRLGPGGNVLYVANRGHDSLAILALQEDGGMALVKTVPCGGQIPRHFAIDPSGSFLAVANQNSDRVSLFAIDRQTGDLTPTDRDIETGTPTCVAFLRIG